MSARRIACWEFHPGVALALHRPATLGTPFQGWKHGHAQTATPRPHPKWNLAPNLWIKLRASHWVRFRCTFGAEEPELPMKRVPQNVLRTSINLGLFALGCVPSILTATIRRAAAQIRWESGMAWIVSSGAVAGEFLQIESWVFDLKGIWSPSRRSGERVSWLMPFAGSFPFSAFLLLASGFWLLASVPCSLLATEGHRYVGTPLAAPRREPTTAPRWQLSPPTMALAVMPAEKSLWYFHAR